MSVYQVYLPVYISYSVEADGEDEAHEKARSIATSEFVKGKVADGDFDIDCNPLIEVVGE